jgi:hypothetical protein
MYEIIKVSMVLPYKANKDKTMKNLINKYNNANITHKAKILNYIINKYGGVTVKDGKIITTQPTTKEWVVGVGNIYTGKQKQITPDFIKQHETFGAWLDNDMLYLDNILLTTKEKAISKAKELKEIAIFNLNTKETLIID